LISGRAVRAEEFLHLEDQKARQKKMATKRSPLRAKAGQARRTGSRRWRRLARSQRKTEAHAPSDIARTEHRRVGSPARRDRRRHLFDADRGLARTRAAAPSNLGAESLAAPKAA
jgi:hypothetical protein